MLQILLAVIGMGMAGALGYALIEQSNLQGAMAISREDNRRLDMAAQTLSRNLVEIPGLNGAVAPLGPSPSYYELPASLNAARTNSQGVPFHYCPLAVVDQRGEVSSLTNLTVVEPGGTSYTINTSNNGVLRDDAFIDASVRSVGAIAVITSAVKGSTQPPPCNEVQMVAGKAIVPNGLARVVTLPGVYQGIQAVTSKTERMTTALIYASQNGSGNMTGSDPTNTAQFDMAWKAIYKGKPQTATIYLTTPVTAGPNFTAYAATNLLNNTDVRVVGIGDAAAQRVITIPNGNAWPVYGTLTLQNVGLSAAQLSVQSMGDLTMVGQIVFYQSTANLPYKVNAGGKMSVKFASMLSDPSGNGLNGVFENNGILDFISSQVVQGGGNPPHYVVTYSSGKTTMHNTLIGRASPWGANRALYPFYVLGNGKLVSDATSNVLRGLYGQCWGHINGDAFLYSYNQVGRAVGVRPDSDFPAPASTAPQTELSAYYAASASRYRAREQNVGAGFSCIED